MRHLRILLFSTVVLFAASFQTQAAPMVDGMLGAGEYSNSFTTGWYTGHNEAGSQFQAGGSQQTTGYWEKDGDMFWLYLEAPLAAKNMIWGTGFTEAEAELYYQHWCTPNGGMAPALDGSNCAHHDDGFDVFKNTKGDFGTMTGSEGVTFAGIDADLADSQDSLGGTSYGNIVEAADSVDYVLANGCDTTDCAASNTPMAFEFKFDTLTGDINSLVSDIQAGDGVVFHLSPERGGNPVPTPSAFLLFGTGLAGIIGWRKWSTKTT